MTASVPAERAVVQLCSPAWRLASAMTAMTAKKRNVTAVNRSRSCRRRACTASASAARAAAYKATRQLVAERTAQMIQGTKPVT